MPLPLLALLLSACTGGDPYVADSATASADPDGDGWLAPDDCDEGDAARHPEAEETCDGADEDCDGVVDEDAPDAATWYTDADGDGWGGDAVTACARPTGAASRGGDCDDTTASVRPDALETCDGVDQDCDGATDEDAADAPAWYVDGDADGFGAGDPIRACAAPQGAARWSGDCDDADASASPAGVEVCDGVDQDCDGVPDDGC